MKITLLLFFLIYPLFAEEESPNTAKLTVVPTDISGTLEPFTLLINGKKIIEKQTSVSAIFINGAQINTEKEPPYSFNETNSNNELKISVVSDGKSEDLAPIRLPSLESLQFFEPSRLVMYTNGKVEAVYIDKNEISVTGQATTIPNSPYWFGFNHIVKLEGPDNSPDRVYNMKLFKKEELVAFKEQGELKPEVPLKTADAEKPREIASQYEPRFKLRFEAGPSLKNVATEPSFNTSALNSFTGGIYGDIPLVQYISFLLGVSYIQKGASVPALRNRFTYIEGAGLLQAKLDSWLIKPFIQAGAALGILISAVREFSNGTTTNIFSLTESLDYGLIAGGGLEFALNKNFSIYAVMRYEWGLKDIDPDPTFISRNVGFRILGGISWAL